MLRFFSRMLREMQGMSSVEWSRFMHEELAVREDPDYTDPEGASASTGGGWGFVKYLVTNGQPQRRSVVDGREVPRVVA